MHTQESTIEPQTAATNSGDIYRRIITTFASVKMTIALMTLIATSVLIGAWCPQESQAGQEKIIETFGEQIGPKSDSVGHRRHFPQPVFSRSNRLAYTEYGGMQLPAGFPEDSLTQTSDALHRRD